MAWVYCNNCFAKNDLSKDIIVNLHLGQCGHIFCNVCLTERCSICGKSYKSTPIGKSMPVHLAMYFEDHQKAFDRLKHVLQFQSEQKARLSYYYSKHLNSEQKKTESETRAIRQIHDKLSLDNERLRSRIEKETRFIAYYEEFKRNEQTQRNSVHLQRGRRPSSTGHSQREDRQGVDKRFNIMNAQQADVSNSSLNDSIRSVPNIGFHRGSGRPLIRTSQRGGRMAFSQYSKRNIMPARDTSTLNSNDSLGSVPGFQLNRT